MLIWTTDNNGQIAGTDRNNDRPEETTLKTTGIGRWHLDKASEKGNGGKWEKLFGASNSPLQTR